LTPTVTPWQSVLINCGGQDYQDVKGRQFVDDAFYSGGVSTDSADPIFGTPDDTLYQSERYGSSFTYDIPVPEGNYEIILHFCELDNSTNTTRVFDISVEETLVFTDVDPSSLVGVRYAMTLETVSVVTDGSLSIAFLAQSGNAQISGKCGHCSIWRNNGFVLQLFAALAR